MSNNNKWKKADLYAFWYYDSYPYVLGGPVEAVDARGRAKIATYGGGVIEPIKLMPREAGEQLQTQLDQLKLNERAARTALDNEWRQKLVDAFGPELTKDAVLADKMRRCEERHYCSGCGTEATGPCVVAGHISQHVEHKGSGYWGPSKRNPVVRNNDGTLTETKRP